MKFPTYTVKKSKRTGKLVLGGYAEETGGAPRGVAMSGYVEETGAAPNRYYMGDDDPWASSGSSSSSDTSGSSGGGGLLDSLSSLFGSVTGAAQTVASSASSSVPLCQFDGKDKGVCKEFDNGPTLNVVPGAKTPGGRTFPAAKKGILDSIFGVVSGGIAGAAATNVAMTQAQLVALQQQQKAKQQQQMLIIGGLAVVGIVLIARTRD